ncbi:hypothetical protein QL992_04130 [Microbacterium sp. APC 3898]|uniref:DUF3951 domain-containing protein n=1 Tax=Planococcus notacanthi TaxID=3035188 RepID=A0ABT7ZLP1_9BACL|nr:MULTISPECIES: hypothetical protein [Terrabacteria group]MBF6632779.1 hypothetical protein [Planococcus sp. (in: firmicutes)]MDN3428076.1 hypothetical protein [Planococcus sp. APC 4016]MDN3438980.1 hypothetical protein [Planococcus sp. APC 3900]MDN3498389.1 hypothetical protein [Microbacterium sp. APC 3898]
MDFLYFPEDKSEYIPGIISVVIIFILSVLIVRLLVKASRKQVKQLEEQGYPVVYKDGFDAEKPNEDRIDPQEKVYKVNKEKAAREKPKS